MGPSGETTYTFRSSAPDVLQRGRQNTVSMRVYHSGAEVTPATWTFSLLDPGGTEIASANGTSSVASATVEAAELPATVATGEGYQEVWVIGITAGPTLTVDREAAVGVRPIYPVVTDLDLSASYPDLAQIRGVSLSSLQGFLDEAWKRIVYRWIVAGGLTYQVKSAWVFREPHIELTMSLFFGFLAKSQQGRGSYMELAEKHTAAFERAWRQMSHTLDIDGDGRVDDTGRRKGGTLLHPNAAARAILPRDPRW